MVDPSKRAFPGPGPQSGLRRPGPTANPVQQANALLARGRIDDALKILDAARLTHAFDPEVWRLRGVALFRAKRLQDAIDAFEEACKQHRGHLLTLISFGNAAFAMGRADRAVEIFGNALALDPQSRDAAFGRAQSELVLGHHDEAAARFQALLKSGPREARCWVGLGRALDHAGRLAEALKAFEQALACGVEDVAAAHCFAASLLLRLGRHEEALARVDALLAKEPGNRQALSIKVCALGRSGAAEAARALMGIDDLVALKALPVPPGYPDMEHFNRDLVAAVEAHPTLAAPRPEMPMSHARKTGNLQPGESPVVDALREGLVGVLEEHTAAARQSGHPYLAVMPERWRFSLWANVLDRQGEIGAHIHPGAWFSGAYYAAMPENASDPQAKPGWIELGRPRDDLAGPDWQIARFFEAKTGHLVLFPSYVYHRTVPFEGPGRRVSFGFDIVPL